MDCRREKDQENKEHRDFTTAIRPSNATPGWYGARKRAAAKELVTNIAVTEDSFGVELNGHRFWLHRLAAVKAYSRGFPPLPQWCKWHPQLYFPGFRLCRLASVFRRTPF